MAEGKIWYIWRYIQITFLDNRALSYWITTHSCCFFVFFDKMAKSRDFVWHKQCTWFLNCAVSDSGERLLSWWKISCWCSGWLPTIRCWVSFPGLEILPLELNLKHQYLMIWGWDAAINSLFLEFTFDSWFDRWSVHSGLKFITRWNKKIANKNCEKWQRLFLHSNQHDINLRVLTSIWF